MQVEQPPVHHRSHGGEPRRSPRRAFLCSLFERRCSREDPQDNAVVQEAEFTNVLPGLQARRAALLAELHEERNRDLELSACDQDHLAELHGAIVEQACVLFIPCEVGVAEIG